MQQWQHQTACLDWLANALLPTCPQEGPTPTLLRATLRVKAKAGQLPASPQAAPAHQEVGSPEADAAVEVATALPRRRLRALVNLLELSPPGKHIEEADKLKQLAGGSCGASRPLVMVGRKAGQQAEQQAEVSFCCGSLLAACWLSRAHWAACCQEAGFRVFRSCMQGRVHTEAVQQQSAQHYCPKDRMKDRMAHSDKSLSDNCTTAFSAPCYLELKTGMLGRRGMQQQQQQQQVHHPLGSTRLGGCCRLQCRYTALLPQRDGRVQLEWQAQLRLCYTPMIW